jgi:hypothetical protein
MTTTTTTTPEADALRPFTTVELPVDRGAVLIAHSDGSIVLQVRNEEHAAVVILTPDQAAVVSELLQRIGNA